MQTISATHFPFVKRVLPFAAIFAACGWTYWSSRDEPDSLLMAIVFAVVLTIIAVFKLRRGLWRAADIVEDHSDRLVITRWRTKFELPIASVREIRRKPFIVGSEVTLVLDKPCPLGLEVMFLAPDKRKSPDIEATLDGLSRRVQSQRGANRAD